MQLEVVDSLSTGHKARSGNLKQVIQQFSIISFLFVSSEVVLLVCGECKSPFCASFRSRPDCFSSFCSILAEIHPTFGTNVGMSTVCAFSRVMISLAWQTFATLNKPIVQGSRLPPKGWT